MRQLEWTLWEQFAPFATWLHDSVLTLAHPFATMLLLAVSVALLGALVRLVRRGVGAYAVVGSAPTQHILFDTATDRSAPSDRVPRGGRGARAPNPPARRPPDAALAR